MRRAILDMLRRGGYILYARHAEATVGTDQSSLNFRFCFTQRNLSTLGRRQAIFYGDALRNLRIPIIYPVQASLFCRTIETAQLAFGRGNTLSNPFWVNLYYLSGNLPGAVQNRILDAFQSALEVQPPRGSNRVIIAHSFPNGIGLGPIANMGTVLIRPLGPGNGYEIVGRLSLEELMGLQ